MADVRPKRRIFITGSSDGLGLLAAKALVAGGHEVVLHARNENRAAYALERVANAKAVLTGDLSSMEETKKLARKANETGPFDAVIHNAGVYQAPPGELLAVNVLAPYLLTALITKPQRLIYLSSDMHLGGSAKLDGFGDGSPRISYSDSKLLVLMLSMAVARKWPGVYSNAVNPGWVPTKMGGKGAPDDLEKGYETQVWLAASDDAAAKESGRYLFHKKESRFHPDAGNEKLQDQLLSVCAALTGVPFP